MPQSFDDTIEALMKQDEALSLFYASLHGLSVPLTTLIKIWDRTLKNNPNIDFNSMLTTAYENPKQWS